MRFKRSAIGVAGVDGLHQPGLDPESRQVAPHELDQLQVGAEALGVEPDQAVQECGGGGHAASIGRGARPVIAAPCSA